MTDNLRTRMIQILTDAIGDLASGYHSVQPDNLMFVDGGIYVDELADAVIRELEAAYVLVPRSVTLVQWADDAFKGQPEGNFKHERITEWIADE